ncbi:MAG: penicillin-binding protein activator [Magnetococcus sp. YQC-5]
MMASITTHGPFSSSLWRVHWASLMLCVCALAWMPALAVAGDSTVPHSQKTGHDQNSNQIGTISPARIVPLDPSDTQSPWQSLINDFLQDSRHHSSRSYLQRTPPTPSAPDQIRELFLALAPLSRDQLKTLLDRQPPSSALLPFIHLVLGDRAAADGEEKEAHLHWQKASLSTLVNTEAMLRLANDANPKDSFVAGLMIPLSGASASMGTNLIMAARKALADYRDVNIHLEVADSGGSAASAQAAVKNLIARGSKIIIGPIFHPEAIAAAKTAAAHNIPIMPLNPRQEILAAGGAVYLNAFQPDSQARIMARHAFKDAGLRRVAILAADTDYGQLQAQTFIDEFMALGGEITHSVLFPEQETDFSTAIKMLVHLDPDAVKARLAAPKTGALDPMDRPAPRSEKNLEPLVDFEALFLPTTAKQARQIASQASLFNIRSPGIALLGASLWNRPELLEETDFLLGGTFCDINQTVRDHFNAICQKILGVTPIPALSMLTYDSIVILAQLLRDQRLGGVEWHQGFTRSTGFYGSAGPVRFLTNGVSERLYHLYQIEEKRTVFLPAPPQNGAPDPNRRPSRADAPDNKTEQDVIKNDWTSPSTPTSDNTQQDSIQNDWTPNSTPASEDDSGVGTPVTSQ